MHDVALVKYEKPFESAAKAVTLSRGLEGVSRDSRVVIKPNFCIWHEGVNFPKYGVLTTARLIEDLVAMLREQGVKEIALLEGVVEIEKSSGSILEFVARGMGLDLLSKRYGVRIVDVLKGEFVKVNAGGVTLSVSKDALEADHLFNLPVLKTHSQVMVSLGIKNLKGLLSIPSRKLCHSAHAVKNLDYHLARLPEFLPPSLTILDGIYTLERGPFYTGKARRSNIIIASRDLISADKVGAQVLGIGPGTVPYIALAARNSGRPTDLSDVRLLGDVDAGLALRQHEWDFEQNDAGNLPLFFERAGIRGITYPKADKTMCTYCADFIYYVITGILMAKNRHEPFDDVEILHGKVCEPSGKHKHTLLVGQCQVKKNGKNPSIRHCVNIRGCPPSKSDLVSAYSEVGIELPEDFIARMVRNPETFGGKYEGRAEFDESFYLLS